MPGIGPMVYRSAHVGAALVAFGSIQFVVAMAWSEWLYPGYSLTQDLISDLGCCGSPAYAVIFNDSVRLLGLCVLVGGFLLRAAFPRRTSARLGIAATMLAGASAFAVGTFPEDSTYLGGHAHALAAALTFFFAGLALVFLALAMLRDTRWGGYRAYTFLSGLVTLVALGLSAAGISYGLGPGGIERLAAAPALLWLIVAGIHVLRIPAFQGGGTPTPMP